MDKPVRIHNLTDCDVRTAEGYYRKSSESLGETFRMNVEEKVENVIRSPNLYGIAFDAVRFARVRRFPYLVLFEFDEDELRIYGVFHSASDPAKWRDRVDDMKSE